ncbi:rhodanese domain-containing protein [Pholiota conissans]|uniref:Rhodanese domain-containing protein n=1 Tax=Pholiota conissans TaxID=109636 RepID=A0A9P6D6D7_9AGAR|nr:rhodanese domain-containing protein [Pholiota conissans]
MIGFRTSIPQSPSIRSRKSSTTSPASAINEGALVRRHSGQALRTLDDVREQVAREIAVHAITKAQQQDGVRIGVRLIMPNNDNEDFVQQVAASLQHQLLLHEHLFAVATTAQSTKAPAYSTLLICGSSQDYVQRAVLLASSKFIGRIITASNEGKMWVATVMDLGTYFYDEDALWDVVRKAARAPMDPLLPPPGAKGIDEILAEARAKLQRISPAQALEELRESQVGAPTFLVDIRPQEQREREGGIGGALIIERNVLEWRFDPRCASRLAIADRYDLRIIIFCQEGYTSSLAAYSLQQIGLLNTTDIIGGYEAWKNAGLPIDIDHRGSRSLASLAGSLV